MIDDLWINDSLDSERNYKVTGIENLEKDYLAYCIKTILAGYIYYRIQWPIWGSFLFPTWINGPKLMLMLFAMITMLATTNACCNFEFEAAFVWAQGSFLPPSFFSFLSESISQYVCISPFPWKLKYVHMFPYPVNRLISDNILFYEW